MPYANTIFHLSNVNPRLDLKHNNLCRTSWLQFFEHLFVSNQAPWDYLKVKEFLVIFSMRVNTCLQNHFLLNRELQHLTSLSVIVPSFFSFFFFQIETRPNDSKRQSSMMFGRKNDQKEWVCCALAARKFWICSVMNTFPRKNIKHSRPLQNIEIFPLVRFVNIFE